MPNLACEHEETATSAPCFSEDACRHTLGPECAICSFIGTPPPGGWYLENEFWAWGRFWRQLLQAWCWCTCDVMRRGFPPCGQKRWKHSGQPWPPPYVRLNVYSNQNAYTRSCLVNRFSTCTSC